MIDDDRSREETAADGEVHDGDAPEVDVLDAMLDAVPDTAPAERLASGAIDWRRVRQRVALIGRTLASTERMDPAEEAELLAERARRLALRVEEASADVRLGLVRVTLGGDPFAVATDDVVAVARGSEVVPLPGAAPPNVALAAWRGRLLPALDVRPLLGLSAPGTHAILVLRDDGRDSALLVDEVETLDDVERAALRRVPNAGRGSGLLRALLPDGTPLLDVPAILARSHASS